jgi:hypothetical protein
MSLGAIALEPAAVLLAALGLLAVGCTDAPTPEMEIDLEPGIDLSDTTDGSESEDSDEPTPDPDSGSGGSSGSGDDPVDPDEGSGSEGSSTGEPSDGPAPPSCNEESIQLTVEPPQVVLLLDKSYSMIEFQWDHDGDESTPMVTRWNSLYNVVDTLTHDVQGEMELGMVLFPSAAVADNDTATACMVDPAPGAPVAPGNADAIVSALPGPDAVDLYGGTPTSNGLAVALQHLAEIADGRPQAVVLVTDGAANCMQGTSGMGVFTDYDMGLSPMVAEAYAGGVPTYVIGVDIVDAVGTYPQDNPYQRLSEVAEAGGVPREGASESFYNTTDEAELLTALGGITAELGCTLTLETPADFIAQLTVHVNGEEVPRVEACGPDGVGWRLLQEVAPFESIELCSATCDDAHQQAGLDVTYACPPEG